MKHKEQQQWKSRRHLLFICCQLSPCWGADSTLLRPCAPRYAVCNATASTSSAVRRARPLPATRDHGRCGDAWWDDSWLWLFIMLRIIVDDGGLWLMMISSQLETKDLQASLFLHTCNSGETFQVGFTAIRLSIQDFCLLLMADDCRCWWLMSQWMYNVDSSSTNNENDNDDTQKSAPSLAIAVAGWWLLEITHHSAQAFSAVW